MLLISRSPEPWASLALSGKPYHFQKESSNSTTTISSFSPIALSNDSRNAKFSITWPLQPDIGRSSRSRLDSSRISPTSYRQINITAGDRMRPQTNSALPPIVMSRTAPLTFASRQRRRLGGNEVTRVPSIYISNSERDKNFHHSTKLTLYHGGSGSQTTLVEHSSALPQSETSNPRPQMFVTKVGN